MPEPWWQTGVIYQLYPRSFADSDGDGVGDLAGIVERLDHLAWLGVDAIWVCPITVSPDTDWGYDVADYCAVQPVLGTLEDVDKLVAEAGARGIRVVLDLVPNHTSDQHPWFVDARSSRRAPHRDFYVWADPKPDGSPPNNWRSSFGGPAWTRDPASGQYYLHNFLASQPDLNWWSEDVRAEFKAPNLPVVLDHAADLPAGVLARLLHLGQEPLDRFFQVRVDHERIVAAACPLVTWTPPRQPLHSLLQ